ncbi:Predicted nucleic acid-binding protein, contains PIN domain [Mameliella alba]|uniref:RSP_2648 family PIN domain-containing protein n=1 Tax=Mameliella alba TaxID=561184 RepID=UPI00088C9879|nr:PIN domain-containing protein [Mameliella alba]OWV50007.1 PIN domain-containing protein [Mameliella alba]PTR42616.1 putative nucleic acid-binding protein [Mameliella alba]GGF72335.1 PIN domain-containing protein [Mameliella alba]SDC17860.1 Predicted nucleic acid-binding protein, contains PIN domain [Mameliella alba]
MKVLLDTCVLYPTVMREVLLGAARAGLYTPLWSERILEEWARAARKLGPEGEAQARAEIALVRAAWPRAEVTYPPSLEKRLWLPDANDTHVLAAAIAGHADVIVTMNASDFPRNILAEEGLSRADPDGFLLGFHQAQPKIMAQVGEAVRAEAERLSGEAWTMRALMKKARLPRLGKALGG